jgi:uncharacterized membrane protein YukC
MMRRNFRRHGFAWLGVGMVVATIVLASFVAFRYAKTQDNTEVASTPVTTASTAETTSAPITSVNDIDTVTAELDQLNLDEIDAQLDTQFDF